MTPRQRISRPLHELADAEHTLYRHFDRTDVLLYIGITVNIGHRTTSHMKKRWWKLVAHTSYEIYPTRAAALAAERDAIKAEKPLYNDQHNDMIVLPPSLGVAEEEPCGEDCDDDCRRHHGDHFYCASRGDMAVSILETIAHVIGPPIFDDAIRYAEGQLALDEDHREHPGEPQAAVIAASYLAHRVTVDYVLIYRAAQRVVASIPADMRSSAIDAAKRDCADAGNPNPPAMEQTMHILRHVAGALAQHFDISPVERE